MAVITASPSNFMRLLDLQQKSLEHVETIRSLIEVGYSNRLEEKQLKTLEKISKSEDEMVVVAKETREIQRSQIESAKKMAEQAAAIASIAESVETFQTMGDRFKASMERLTKPFSSMSSFRESLLKKVNFGGIANKAIAKEQFIQEQKKLGSSKSDSELRKDFEVRNTAAKDIKKNEAEIEKFRKQTGLSEAQLAKTEYGKGLLAKRQELTSKFAPTDLKTKFAGDEGDSEVAIEQTKMAEENLEVQKDQQKSLERIETYLKPGDARPSADKSSSGGGGMLGGLADGLKKLGPVLAQFGGAVGKAILGFFRGLASGLAALANPLTLVGLGAFTLAAIGLGKALELAAPAIDAFAPVLMKVAEVIGTVFVKAIETIPAVLEGVSGVISTIGQTIMGIMDAVVESIERLSQVDGANLLSVGAGLVAVAGGMAAFGAGNAIAGVGNLVGGLMSKISGQKSPVEQLEQIAGFGENLEKAGVGVEKLGKGLTSFSSIDADKIKAVAALPVEKIAAMGAAMNTPAATVSQGSAANAAMATQAGGGGGSTVVAPVQNNTQQVRNTVVKLPTRNNDGTYLKYNRYLTN